MSSKSYIVLIVLALSGLAFLARPEAKVQVERIPAIYDGPPANFELVANGLQQEMTNGLLLINKTERPASGEKLKTL